MKEQEIPFGILLKTLGEGMVQKINSDIQDHGLTSMQGHVLMCLHCAPDHTRPLKELEGYFSVAQSTMAGIVSRLEKKGLVVPLTSAEDRRVKLVRLTPAGLAESEICRALIHRTEEKLTSRMTGEDRAAFRRLLTLAIDTVSQEEGEKP